MKGGNNNYGYVGGSPLTWADPKGQLKWSGAYAFGTAGLSAAKFGGVGGIGGSYTFKSDCNKNGLYAIVQGTAWGMQSNIGASPFKKGLSLSLSQTRNFDDGRGDSDPDPSMFSGIFSMLALNSPVYSYGQMILGSVVLSTNDFSGPQINSDFSGISATGISIAHGEVKCCKK